VGAAEFDLWDRAGDVIARYVLVFADGGEQVLPIRRRLEVNEWVPALTPPPLTAISHGNYRPVDFRGPYAKQGALSWGLPGSSSMQAMPSEWAVGQSGIGYSHDVD